MSFEADSTLPNTCACSGLLARFSDFIPTAIKHCDIDVQNIISMRNNIIDLPACVYKSLNVDNRIETIFRFARQKIFHEGIR